MVCILRRNLIVLFILFLFMTGHCFAQTTTITSGAIYSIKSKFSGRVLNVTNSSSLNNANVDNWIDTNSDSQQWMITKVGDNLYTFTNVASGKLLHIANSIPANGVNVNQYTNVNNNTVQWSIVDTGDGFCYIKSAANQDFAVTLSATTRTDGVNVQVSQFADNVIQKWSFKLQEKQEIAPTAAIADQVFDAWKVKCDIVNIGGFWGTAEMMEIVLDAYEVTGKAKYVEMFNTMYNKFVAREGQDWMGNDFNDDITWISIACVRSYLLTGNTVHLAKAKQQFDKMFARANTHQFGGDGLVWKQGVVGTNSCINGPAMVCCSYLAQATGDLTYYKKAITLYNWSKLYLFNETTGKVNDNYNGTTIGNWSSTYNQGTYLGAAVMLYNYTHDPAYLRVANRIAAYTKDNMFKSDVINSEDGNDLEGFKGIFMRYARRYIIDCNRPDLIPWLQLNAKVAYRNRNSKNLINTLWGNKTSEITPKEFGASTAVSLMINCPLSLEIKKSAYQTIESEDFNYLKGVIVEACPEGTSNLGGVKDGYFSQYNNVDFGFKGSSSVEFRLSSASTGGTIETRLGGSTGKLIGTAEIPNTGNLNTYSTFTFPVANVKGMQNICFVYKGTGPLFNINNFKFTEANGSSETNGLLGSYYSGLNFEKLVVQRIDSTVNFNWAEQSPAVGIANDRYSVRWTGKIQPLYSGDYTFYIKSDNGRRVWINNELIIDKWINNWGVEYSGTIHLTAGEKYDLKVDYFETDGDANIQLEWKRDQQVREVIPAAQLYLPTDGITANELEYKTNGMGDLSIYPNPVTSQLTINCVGSLIENIRISGMNGRILYSKDQQPQESSTIDVSKFKNGMYLLTLKTDKDETMVRKFVK